MTPHLIDEVESGSASKSGGDGVWSMGRVSGEVVEGMGSGRSAGLLRLLLV